MLSDFNQKENQIFSDFLTGYIDGTVNL